MLKCDQLGGKGGANLPPKGPQTRWPAGGWAIIYDDVDYDDDEDDDDNNDFDEDDDDYDVFSWSQRTSTTIGTIRGANNYDDDDGNDDDDVDDNNDDDDEVDYVFSKNIFFFIIIVEAPLGWYKVS